MVEHIHALAAGPTATAVRSWILEHTEIPNALAMLLAVLILAVAVLLMTYRTSVKFMWRCFAAFCAVCIIALGALGGLGVRVVDWVCEENHIIEWFTADFLLVAWILALILTIHRARKGKPSPLMALLTGGYFWGFWREVEFGKPFFGQKWIYTRNFFRIRAYYDPTYFENFRNSLGHTQHRPLMLMHWVAAVIAVTCIVLVVVYLSRHRKTFRQELRELPRSACGKFFLTGAGICIAAQLGGRLFHVLSREWFTPDYRRVLGFSYAMLDEPLECMGALCFLLSVIAFWQASRQPVRSAQPSSPPGGEPARLPVVGSTRCEEV